MEKFSDLVDEALLAYPDKNKVIDLCKSYIEKTGRKFDPELFFCFINVTKDSKDANIA